MYVGPLFSVSGIVKSVVFILGITNGKRSMINLAFISGFVMAAR